uniref:Uncharacterized protein n=1 Tax=Panagrolaimus sp. ES5 TaxID=591445 RepID=A0AC34G4G1_9BILA
METPQKLPPFPTGTSTRPRRQMRQPEFDTQPLYDELLGVLNIALNDPSRAGVMMQEIAHRELHPPGGTPFRNQQRNNNRITPYSFERRPSNRFGNQHSSQNMFSNRNNLFAAPVTPTRPLEYFPPATCSANSSTPSKAPQQSTEFSHPATQSRSTDAFTSSRTAQQSAHNFNPVTFSRSADSHTPTPSPQRPSLLPLPATVSRVHNLPDFQSLHTKPCLRVILSETSIVSLSRPVHCVFNEETREWIIADKDRGIVFLNNDCFFILRSITEFEEPCAVALLNNGHLLGVLDRNGIFIYDQFSGEKRLVFSQPDCRGLAVSVTGDFVTVNYKLRYIFIVPQNGDTPTYF